MIPGLVAALRAVVPVQPQPAPPHADTLTDRFETGPVVVRLGRSPFAGHHPAHLPGSTPRAA